MLKRLMFFSYMAFCLFTGSQIVGEVVEGPNGPVEFIGLENWTASNLFEAIKKKETDPDKPFHACAAVMKYDLKYPDSAPFGTFYPERPFHACAVVMKQDLKFPDAAAFGTFKPLEDGSQELYTVIVAVENRSFVRYRATGSESLELPESWQKLQAEVEVWQAYDPIDTFVKNLKKDEREHRLALEVLEKDESWSARLVAVIVVGQFPNKEESWHALADSLIDPDPKVRDWAEYRLIHFLNAEKAVPIDWVGARDTLRSLLGGTYPFAFKTILNVLSATEIDSKFARELVQERPKLLLGFVGAEHENTRQVALTFLKSISDEDFEQDVEAWRDWIGVKDQDSID